MRDTTALPIYRASGSTTRSAVVAMTDLASA
jgi:hypothetical protein